MTCDECQAAMDRNPLDCTAAERSAVSRHLTDCPACGEGLKAEVGPVMARMPPAKLALLRLVALGLRRRDGLDPEA